MLAHCPIVYIFLYTSNLKSSRAYYEQKLRLRLIEEDPKAAKYDVGGTILALNETGNPVATRENRDSGSLLVFHTLQFDKKKEEVESLGVKVGKVEKYEIGATAGFVDDDGHCYNIYEPSDEAMSWPSAKKIRAILESSERLADQGSVGAGPLLYLFLFVPDFVQALDFYENKLGLRPLERDDGAGVVKYDVGGMLLSIHFSKGAKKPLGSYAPTFWVPDIKAAHEDLAVKGVPFSGPIRSSNLGLVAEFRDPFGQQFYLYEPSKVALDLPSGPVLKSLAQKWSHPAKP